MKKRQKTLLALDALDGGMRRIRSLDAMVQVEAFEQLAEFATQDASELLKSFEPMRGPIQQRVVDFKNRMVADETKQLDALVAYLQGLGTALKSGKAAPAPTAEAAPAPATAASGS